jgi:hypothetical protein
VIKTPTQAPRANKVDDSAEAGDGGPAETDADRAGVKRSDKADPDPVHMS